MKKIIIISVIVIALGVAAFFLFFNGTGNAYTFRFDKISKGDLTVYVTATGTLNAVTSVDVGTQVSGIISRLYADFNSIVKAGQIIAQIDPTFLDQAVKDAEANLDRVTAQFNQTQRTYERTKAMFDKQLESQSNYDAALANFEGDKASLKQAQAQLDKAKLNLQYATIYAPINGVVINRQVSVGQTVAASFSSPTLFTIANDLSKMQVETTVDESDIGRVSVGQSATFTVDAYPDDNFSGTVSQIRLAPQVVQNVVNYTVIISVENDNLKLMPGMTANVKVLVGQKKNVLNVSNLALRFQPPSDLIDTTALKEMRDMFRSKSKDQMGMNQKSDDKQNKNKNEINPPKQLGQAKPDQSGKSQGMFTDIDRNMFQAMRDSIIKAHGGKMSREEMMAEFKKAYDKFKQADQQKKAAKVQQQEIGGANNYAIINNYPQYEKSSYVPTDQFGRGRVWILNSKGKLEPLFVRTGLNDGKSTEIFSDKLTEGQQIVIGADSNGDQATPQSRNPLAGQQNQDRFRGR